MRFDPNHKRLLSELKKVAKQRVKKGKQFTEFTGLIGELAVCELKDYTWDPQEGYDAKDKYGKKIQIKARRLQTSKNLKDGRLGRFGSAREPCKTDNYKFCRGILVVLDCDFEIAAIWERDKNEIECLENEDKEKVPNRKSDKLPGLTVSKFIKNKCHLYGGCDGSFKCLNSCHKKHFGSDKIDCDGSFECLNCKHHWNYSNLLSNK